MKKPAITLLAPGALTAFPSIDPSVLPHAPALSRLLTRADPRPFPGIDPEALLCEAFGVRATADGDLPVAWFSWLSDFDTPPDTAVLRADPVHLRADASGLLLFGPGQLDIQPDEAAQLLAALNGLYAERGWRFHSAQPQRWYLSLPDAPRIATRRPGGLLGQDISGRLPTGEEAGEWHTVLNEIQMLLHSHPVNERRQAEGRPAINSLWLWGGGRPAGQSTACPWTRVWSDHPLAMGLARHAGCERSDVPDSFAGMDGPPPGTHLLVLDGLHPAAGAQDFDAWRQGVERLESAWAGPLVDALRRGRLASVSIAGGNGLLFHSTRRSLMRFWRRPTPFHTRLQHHP